jgi:hypothetical protein
LAQARFRNGAADLWETIADVVSDRQVNRRPQKQPLRSLFPEEAIPILQNTIYLFDPGLNGAIYLDWRSPLPLRGQAAEEKGRALSDGFSLRHRRDAAPA